MWCLCAAVEAKLSEWTPQPGVPRLQAPRPARARELSSAAVHLLATLLAYTCTICLFLKMFAFFTVASLPLSVREKAPIKSPGVTVCGRSPGRGEGSASRTAFNSHPVTFFFPF